MASPLRSPRTPKSGTPKSGTPKPGTPRAKAPPLPMLEPIAPEFGRGKNLAMVLRLLKSCKVPDPFRTVFFAKLLSMRKELESVKIPNLGGRVVDLYLLFAEVSRRGGHDAVTKGRAWKQVSISIGIPAACTSGSTAISKHYKTFLLEFERALQDDIWKPDADLIASWRSELNMTPPPSSSPTPPGPPSASLHGAVLTHTAYTLTQSGVPVLPPAASAPMAPPVVPPPKPSRTNLKRTMRPEPRPTKRRLGTGSGQHAFDVLLREGLNGAPAVSVADVEAMLSGAAFDAAAARGALALNSPDSAVASSALQELVMLSAASPTLKLSPSLLDTLSEVLDSVVTSMPNLGSVAFVRGLQPSPDQAQDLTTFSLEKMFQLGVHAAQSAYPMAPPKLTAPSPSPYLLGAPLDRDLEPDAVARVATAVATILANASVDPSNAKALSLHPDCCRRMSRFTLCSVDAVRRQMLVALVRMAPHVDVTGQLYHMHVKAGLEAAGLAGSTVATLAQVSRDTIQNAVKCVISSVLQLIYLEHEADVVPACNFLHLVFSKRAHLPLLNKLPKSMFDRLAELVIVSAPSLEDVVYPEDEAHCPPMVAPPSGGPVVRLVPPVVPAAAGDSVADVVRDAARSASTPRLATWTSEGELRWQRHAVAVRDAALPLLSLFLSAPAQASAPPHCHQHYRLYYRLVRTLNSTVGDPMCAMYARTALSSLARTASSPWPKWVMDALLNAAAACPRPALRVDILKIHTYVNGLPQ